MRTTALPEPIRVLTVLKRAQWELVRHIAPNPQGRYHEFIAKRDGWILSGRISPVGKSWISQATLGREGHEGVMHVHHSEMDRIINPGPDTLWIMWGATLGGGLNG